jgi:arginyl-tRNA synthetase
VELSAQYLGEIVTAVASNGVQAAPHLAGAPRRVLIDFASPNMCKALHVGHLRSAVLGDSLARLLSFHGHSVARISHVGDWGTPVAMVLALCERDQPPEALDAALPLPAPALLDRWYVAAKRAFDAEPGFRAATYDALQRLQGRDPAVHALWARLCEASRIGFNEVCGGRSWS